VVETTAAVNNEVSDNESQKSAIDLEDIDMKENDLKEKEKIEEALMDEDRVNEAMKTVTASDIKEMMEQQLEAVEEREYTNYDELD